MQVIEQRLAAMMAVWSNTPDICTNERGTVREWQAIRKEIIKPSMDRFFGQIIKNTGDGFLAEFKTVAGG